MSEHDKRYFQQEILHRPLQKHGLLEEFNLPPRLIAFIRTNRTRLIVGLVVCALLLLAGSAFRQYSARQNDRAASLLAEAMAESDNVRRKTLLEQVGKEYGRTGSAGWARLELGHLAFDAAQYEEAIGHYRASLDSKAGSGPFSALIELNLAQALEAKNDLPQALAVYQKLVAVKEFAPEALLAIAGIEVRQGALPKVREQYRKLLAIKDLSPLVKELAQSQLDRL